MSILKKARRVLNSCWHCVEIAWSYLSAAWDYCARHRRTFTLILIFIIFFYIFCSFVLCSIKSVYSFIVYPEPKEVRVHAVTKYLKCFVVRLRNSPHLLDIDSVTLNNFSLNLSGTTVQVKNLNNEKNKDFVSCLITHGKILSVPATKKRTVSHTIISKKGKMDFNIEVENTEMEFEKSRSYLRLQLNKGKIREGEMNFDKCDKLELRSNGDLVCNSNRISQKEDWNISITNLGELYFINFLSHGVEQEVNIDFKERTLINDKDIFTHSTDFPFEVTNLFLSDAKGNVSVGKDHTRMEEYDILQVTDSENTKSSFKVDTFRFGKEGIVIKTSGKARNIYLNGVQLNKSRLYTFLTDPGYLSIVAAALVIMSSLFGYVFRRLFERSAGR